MSTKTAQGTIWVCEDCTLVHAGYSADELGYTPAVEPWGLEPAIDVTPGQMAEDHAEDCPNHGTWAGEECECDVRDFSSSSCDGCGDTNGGTRHAFTYWD